MLYESAVVLVLWVFVYGLRYPEVPPLLYLFFADKKKIKTRVWMNVMSEEMSVIEGDDCG